MDLDRFGFGTKNKNSVGMFDGKNQRDHATLFGRFIQPTLIERGASKKDIVSMMGKFMQSDFEDKVFMLQELSNDTDDALWRSDEFLRIAKRANG